MAGLAGIFAQALYQSFIQFGEWAMPELITILVAEKIGDCSEFVKSAVQGMSEAKVNRICQGVGLDNYRSYWNLIEPCNT